ncbi:hypothetical protein [Tenacibaculum agarivorans]|uniref:hypothetical protein n=1 Tax=Tenacibaculum agarivorans TaxID=1908389 RepID=UPI00094BBD3A|nr:hypothetical protein [Tenacibaculum agarivorans]
MKYLSKGLIFLVLIFIVSSLEAQVRIGNFQYSKYKHKKLKKKSVKRFTDTKTIFILPDFISKEAYKKLLDEVWDITPYELINVSSFDTDIVKKDMGLARFKTMEIKKTTKSGMMVSYIYNFLDFHVVDKLKEWKKKTIWYKSRVAAIYFTPDVNIRKQVEASSGERELYGDLLNFRLGYLKNYLQLVNNSLKELKSVDIYDDFTSPELKNLKDKTLYIDSNLLYGYNPFTINTKKSPEIEKLTKNYSYNFEVIEYKDLEEKILSEKEDFYYLMHNQINSNKIINIVNGRTGEIVYQKHTTISYNIKPKDFKKISSKIKKLNK